MMSNQIKVLLVAFTVTAILAVVPASAVVINDFEGSAGNAIDWSSGLDIDADPNYSYAAVGVTSGSQSVRLDQCGWAQSLAFKLDTAQKADFMANSYFSIDMSVAATPGISSGYTQIYEVVMNAPGPGWTAVATGTPLNFYWWDGRPTETQTLFVDYSAFRQAITTTDYIEIILTTNNGGGAPCEMYFDNAQLYGGTGELGDYENEVMLDSPALYLQMETDGAFNSGSGSGVMIDSSGNNFWAAYRADVEFWANEGIGNCRYLPGNDGQNAIGAANSTEFPGWTFDFSDTYAFAADDISFELWFNADVDLGAYDVFFHQVGTRLYQAPGLGNSDGTLRVLNGRPTNPIPPDPNDPNESSQFWWYTGVETPLDGQWHQAVVTYQESYGTADEMQIQLYLDGKFQASTVVGDATWPARLGPELDHVVIGGVNDIGYVWNSYKGLVDEFAIYDGVLSADRIAIHYAAGMCEMSQGDITGDCKVDFADFAVVVMDWLGCNDPNLFGSDPDCGPTW